MSSLIRDLAGSSAAMLATFGDETLLRAALDFEAALATASAAEGLFAPALAEAIADACATAPGATTKLAEEAALAGTLAIPLVARLRERLSERRPEAACWVHHGATSQDLADTALMLQARAASELVLSDAARVARALERLARAHAETPMTGRTLLQAARPITFGLKAAQWLAGVDAAVHRFERERTAAIVLQLGGPVGTLAGFDGRGGAVAARMAATLGLGASPPWHTRRDGVASLGGALAILCGTLGKIAGDVGMMAASEVAEAREPPVPGRGGSSAMPHKHNPTGCQIARSAALRAPHLAATLMAGLGQEHERGLGGWQAEAPVLAQLFGVAHGALTALAPVLEGLVVDPQAMAGNLAAADIGADVGESVRIVHDLLAARQADS